MRKLLAQTGVLLFALATFALLDHVPPAVASDGTSETPIATGTIDQNIINSGSNWFDTQWILTCGYHSCGKGGGKLHRETCTPDNIFCFADSQGHTFARSDAAPGGTFDGYMGGLWEDGTHDDTAALNATLTAAAAHSVGIVAICGQTLASSADISIPNTEALDGCSEPPGLSAGNFTFASGLPGILAHPSTTNIHGSLRNIVVERSDGLYPPTTFVAVSTRDALNAAGAMAGTGVILDLTAAQLHNVLILGFNQCVSVVMGAAGSAGEHIHGDCTNGISAVGLGSGVSFTDVGFPSYLTHGIISTGALDNVLTSGSNYKAVIAIPPLDTASSIALKNSDPVYVSISPLGGAQSLGDKQTISCSGGGGFCASVPNGTDGCASATTCQEAVIVGSSVTPVTLTATWAAGLQTNGVAQPLIVSSIAGLAVGQGISTAGACSIPANVTIKDVFAVGDTFWIIPNVPLTPFYLSCAGTAQSVTFSDGATVAGVFTAGSFTHDGRGVEVSGVQRSGDAAYIAHGGGLEINGFNGYTHFHAINCDTGGSNTRFSALANGLNDPLGDHQNIGIWIHGDHTGNDCDNFEAVGGEASQHITNVVKIESDGAKINRFGYLNVGPAPGRSTGTAYDVEAGKAVFNDNTAKNAGNLIVADGTTYRILYADKAHLGTGYTAGNTVTTNNGTCSVAGQLVIDTVVSGVPATWHQSVQPVCTVWPSDFTVTGGSGTGLQLVTDGLVTSTAVVTGNATPNIDYYIQSPLGTAYSGLNNICTLWTACNSQQNLAVVGSGSVNGGMTVQGLEPLQGRSSMVLRGNVSPSVGGSVASSIADVQGLFPTSTATSVGGEQMLPVIGGCAACDPSSFGTFLYGGHIIYDASYAGPNPIPAEWDINPAKPTWNIYAPILDHVYYALPGGPNSCEPTNVINLTVKCEGISVGSFPDIPGAGTTMTISSGVFNVPNGSPNVNTSDLEARAIQIGGTPGTASGGAVLNAYGILETSTATNQFAGDVRSNDTHGWFLGSTGHACSATSPTISPERIQNNTGFGCHTQSSNSMSLIANNTEALWLNSSSVTIPVMANLSGGLTMTSLLASVTAPTISSGFGTSPSIPNNNGTAAFTLNVGTGGSATSGVIGLPAAATGWICMATDRTTPGANFTKQSASSTTSATLTNYNSAGSATAWTASDVLALHCQAY